MSRVIERIKCALMDGHRMEKYQSKMVKGVFVKELEAHRTRCVYCLYVQKYWVGKEKSRQPVRYK